MPNITEILTASLLGIVEGVTEFLPISSTGHLILLTDILGFKGPPNRIFEVVIQLGAILGVCWVYRRRLMETLAKPSTARSQHLFVVLTLGFLPAAIVGFLAHDFIKSVLFNPKIVCVALVVGGIAIIIVEKVSHRIRIDTVDAISPMSAFLVGFGQVVAMVPGTSRSAATIIGGRLLGMSRGTAAEFSFLLAIPTMFAASGYDLYKNMSLLSSDDAAVIAVGFVSALVTAVVTVEWLIRFVSTWSFRIFGWYRIALGVTMYLLLMTGTPHI